MERSGKGPRRTLFIALMLALLVHLVLGPAIVGVVIWLDRRSGEETEEHPKILSITLEKQLEVSKPHKQVVSIPPPRHEEAPRKPSFLSEFDSSVKHETQAKHKHAGKYLSNQSNPAPGESRLSRPASAAQPGTSRKTQPGRARVSPLDMRAGEQQPGQALPEGSRARPKGGEVGKKTKPLSLAQLTPSPNQLQRALGSAFPDALSDVDGGDKTLLNTKRWRFSSFFNRVKAAVAQQWHPDHIYKRRDPTGKVYGFHSRLTVLRVWLYPDGRLKQIFIAKSCGLDFLDDEAVRAFKAAAPFPNPPRRLVDRKTGLISFRFGFLFEIVKGPVFKIFRYR